MHFWRSLIELHLLILSVFIFFPFTPSYLWQVMVKAFFRSEVEVVENCTEFTDTTERMLLSVEKMLLRLMQVLPDYSRRDMEAALDWWDNLFASRFKVRSINLRLSWRAFFVKFGWTDAWREVRLIVPILGNVELIETCYGLALLWMLAVLGMVYSNPALPFSLLYAGSHLSSSLSRNWNCLFLGSSSKISRLLLTLVKLKVLAWSTISSWNAFS